MPRRKPPAPRKTHPIGSRAKLIFHLRNVHGAAGTNYELQAVAMMDLEGRHAGLHVNDNTHDHDRTVMPTRRPPWDTTPARTT